MKILSSIIVFFNITVNVLAYDFSVDGIYYSKGQNNTVYVTFENFFNSSYVGNITIPSTVAYNSINYSVVSIGPSAFGGCAELISVSIPSSVTTIGNYAFYRCAGLTSIDLSSSLEAIGNYAFSYCVGLTSIDLPSSLNTLGDDVFSYCEGLTSVTLPSSVTSVGNSVFLGCKGLVSVNLPSSLTKISGGTFMFCVGLKTIEIPSSVTEIGSSAFTGCTGLTSVNSPPSLTSIGSYAFSNCHELSYVSIPSSVSIIGDYAFNNCSGYITVDAENVNFSSKDGVLFDKDKTTLIHCPISISGSLIIPGSVTSISDGAIYNCTRLTSVAIPSSVSSIGFFPFSGSSGYISVDHGNLNYSSKDGVLYNKNKTALLHCPISISGSFIVPSTVTDISSNVFLNCARLTSVTIPSAVMWIGSRAFSGCSDLISIKIEARRPPELGTRVFDLVDKSNCILYVPNVTTGAYMSSDQWKDFKNIIPFDVTGIKDVAASSLKVYPGMAESLIQIDLEDSFFITKLMIFNSSGQLFFEVSVKESLIKLDISNFPAGIYYLKSVCGNNHKQGVGKFIKK